MKSIFLTIMLSAIMIGMLSAIMIGQNEKKSPVTPIVAMPADFVVRSPNKGNLVYRKGHTGIGLRYMICVTGKFPTANEPPGSPGPFVGEIRIFAPLQDHVIPAGWMVCEGQLLSINPYQMLFALIGTEYGGNGQTNFALPDLRGATVVGAGNGWTITEKSN